MRLGPRRAPRVDAAVTEQKRQQLLTRAPQRLHRTLSSAHQIADGFMSSIWDPNRRQLARSMELGQAQRVAPVGLDSIPRTLRDKRWSHHHAIMTQRDDLPVEVITCRSRFITEMQPRPPFRQLRGHSRY